MVVESCNGGNKNRSYESTSWVLIQLVVLGSRSGIGTTSWWWNRVIVVENRGVGTTPRLWSIFVAVVPRSGLKRSSVSKLLPWSNVEIIESNYLRRVTSRVAVGQPFCYYEATLVMAVPLS